MTTKMLETWAIKNKTITNLHNYVIEVNIASLRCTSVLDAICQS